MITKLLNKQKQSDQIKDEKISILEKVVEAKKILLESWSFEQKEQF